MTQDGGVMVGADFKPAPTWDSQIGRCRTLSQRYPSARDVLDFYQKILTFQKGVYGELKGNKYIRRDRPSGLSVSDRAKALSLQFKEATEILFPHIPSLLSIAREGPTLLAAMAKEVAPWGRTGWEAAIEACSEQGEPNCQYSIHTGQPLFFFPRALLQPYLQCAMEEVGAYCSPQRICLRHDNTPLQTKKDDHAQMADTPLEPRCPFCGHRPQTGYLRPTDNASQRFLICSLCHGEWSYKRLSCPGCTESDKTKLSYLVAEGWPAVRLDVCDTCRRYIKTIDLGKDPEAVPVVDELATVPLDLWARERGYEKLELNLAGI